MVRPIMRDPLFLSQPSVPATKADAALIQDLKDTLAAHRDGCVGMAANMIGVHKNMIIVSMGMFDVVMINPKIIAKSKAYQTEEGCLSLPGERPTTRYENITVEYQDTSFQKKTGEFSGYIAQIIQHECDHLEGILI